MILLDGPMGTELGVRGVPLPEGAWSAHALVHAPEVVAAVHRDYAAAGATVHTSCTFRTRAESVGAGWAQLARDAVRIARDAVPAGHRVAGSVAPVFDCYRPDLSPPDAGPRHRALCEVLAEAGVDLILCETFPHVGEALAAAQAALATGLPTWVSFTAGPEANLLTAEAIAHGARRAVDLGAAAVLVNCVPATDTARFLAGLAGLGVPFGAYANAGHPDEAIGWRPDPDGPDRYASLAGEWVEAGASIVGSCCGTGPTHIRALREALGGAAG